MDSDKFYFMKFPFKNEKVALAWQTSCLGDHSLHQNVSGSIPGQDTYGR